MVVITAKFPASISVSNLNGVNGFAITGFPVGSYGSQGGNSVSGAGDVNADGIADLIVGAPLASTTSGASYVLFGQSGIGSSGSVSVSSLSGSNGFAITGFAASSYGGWSVSKAGDVNDDGIADLVIGAYYYSSGGAVYVLFGQSGIGSSGSVSVPSDGFAISGFSTGEFAGYSVSEAGDVNDDGIADLVFGAPAGVSNGAGKSYVIFGKSGLGSSGSMSISSLTGSNGFVITGFPASSGGGWSVSGAGDVNDDGIADLIIGAPYASSNVGAGYVLFGQSGIGSSGSLSVASLTGSNGFVITGFPANSKGGYSVSGAGDVNDDGIADLIIGAPYSSGNTGTCYVLFGRSGIGSSGSVSVSSLTGSNGFTITGFSAGNYGGYSVNGAGDLNGDGIADLIIGAYGVSSNAGASYVLFGQSGIGSSGSVSISSLTGSNGFAVTFPANSEGGWSVNGAGDVNGDGIADLIIGAPCPYGTSCPGESYVIFGESTSLVLSRNQLTIKEDQTLPLSSQYLNATSLKSPSEDSTIQFTVSGIQHGRFYSSTDISLSLTSFTQQQVRNGQIYFAHDGSSLAPSYNVSAGYPGLFAITVSPPQPATVIFQQSFVLVNSMLTINQGETVVLTSSYLSANDLYNNANNPYLVFSVSNVQHGFFSLTTAPTTPITSFTQSQVQNGNVQFIQDGSTNPPSYNVAVMDGAASISAQAATISFDAIPIFINNSLTINQAQTAVLSSSDLSANNPYNSGASLTFAVSNVQHGYFALTSAPTVPITNFTQAQIQGGIVQFVQDGSANAPSYSLTVSDGRTTSAAQASTISFDAIPTFNANSLTINQGQTVVLTSSNLNASDAYAVSGFTYTVSQVQHGYFALTTAPTAAITSFTQAKIQNGSVQFVHDGGINPPSYSVSVSDGRMTSSIQAASISFDATPVIQNNSLSVSQGQTITLSSSNMSAVNPYNSAAVLTFMVSNVQHGYFALISAPTTPISSFTQTQIQSDDVQFVQDGSTNGPSYSVSVSDGRATSSVQAGSITFNSAPVIANNNLVLYQGQTVVLSSSNLSATGSGSSGNYVFRVSNVQHGQFELVSNPGSAITTFTQAQIQSGAVQFVQDGSAQAPSYSVSVSGGIAVSLAQSSDVTFSLHATPVLVNNALSIQQGQTVILTSNDLSATDPEDSAGSLVFTVSNVQHGYFALASDPSSTITSFTQAQIESGVVEFISDGGSIAPSYSVSVGDPYSSTAPASAIVKFTQSSSQIVDAGSSNSTTVRNAIIGATVSGALGLLFLGLKLYLTYRATKSMKKILEGEASDTEKRQATYHKEVIRPIANIVFERIKTTGFLGYRSDESTIGYISAIETIVGRLGDLGINLNFSEMGIGQQNKLLNEIVKQIRSIAILKHKTCSAATLYGFFRPEVTPQQIEDKADQIAQAIQKAMAISRKSSTPKSPAPSDEDVELSEVKIAA